MRTVAGALAPVKHEADVVTIDGKKDPTRTMKAVQWHGKKDVRVGDIPRPLLTDPQDAIVRITSAAICGSDLHLYLGTLPGMKKGDQLGHEMMGIVEEVGPGVKNVKVGDRVVICSNISCGECWYCQRQLNIYCPRTNPGTEMELLFGSHCSGLYGYSQLTGGYPGGQAEYLRVPLADNGCLKVPTNLPDEKVLFLSDILSTAWYGCEMGEVGEGDSVAIWGAGPVGQLAAACCKVRGAKRIIVIDREQYRLDHVAAHVPGVETINAKEESMPRTLKDKFPELGGPDVCMEAVGLHYAHNPLHKIEMKLAAETDSPEVINEMLQSVRKCGRVSMIGDWAGYANHVLIGAIMEKGLTVRGGLTPMQKYWHHLLNLIQEGQLDPSFIVTHTVPLEEAPKYYKLFNDKKDGVIKVVLKPGAQGALTHEA